jgi:hypothetical protein
MRIVCLDACLKHRFLQVWDPFFGPGHPETCLEVVWLWPTIILGMPIQENKIGSTIFHLARGGIVKCGIVVDLSVRIAHCKVCIVKRVCAIPFYDPGVLFRKT